LTWGRETLIDQQAGAQGVIRVMRREPAWRRGNVLLDALRRRSFRSTDRHPPGGNGPGRRRCLGDRPQRDTRHIELIHGSCLSTRSVPSPDIDSWRNAGLRARRYPEPYSCPYSSQAPCLVLIAQRRMPNSNPICIPSSGRIGPAGIPTPAGAPRAPESRAGKPPLPWDSAIADRRAGVAPRPGGIGRGLTRLVIAGCGFGCFRLDKS
jgi:hypothetical protein